MRKNILFVILFTSLFFAIQAKDKKEEVIFPMDANGKIVYTEVIEMPNITKDALYSRANEWFAKTFNSAQNVIQMQDKEAGKIIGKGIIDEINGGWAGGVKGYVKFIISIYLKDGKYKYEITDLFHEGFCNGPNDPRHGGAMEDEKPDCTRNYISLGDWKRMKAKTNERVLSLIESLKKAMLVEAAGDNW